MASIGRGMSGAESPNQKAGLGATSREHARALLRFLFQYGPLAPAIGDDMLPWRLVLRGDDVEVHAAAAELPADGGALEALLVECGGAVAFVRMVLARLGFETSVRWGLREGTHLATVRAGAWRRSMVSELPALFGDEAPASGTVSRATLVEGWQSIACAHGATLELGARNDDGERTSMVACTAERPLERALRFVLQGVRGGQADESEQAPPCDDGFVAWLRAPSSGPAALLALGHAATDIALDARAQGYAFASGPLEHTSAGAVLPISLARAAEAPAQFAA